MYVLTWILADVTRWFEHNFNTTAVYASIRMKYTKKTYSAELSYVDNYITALQVTYTFKCVVLPGSGLS